MTQDDRRIRPGDRVVELVQVERVWFACNRPGHKVELVQVERVWFACNRPGHKHATEQGARGCMDRHGPPMKRPMAKQDKEARARAIVDAVRKGATLREAGAPFGLSKQRTASIISTYEAQCRNRMRLHEQWAQHQHRIAVDTQILLAATEVVDDALRMWAQQGVHTREHAAYAAMDYLSRLSR